MKKQPRNPATTAISRWLVLPACLIVASLSNHSSAESLRIEILPGEYWWGGLSAVGHQTPYDAASVADHDMFGDNMGNQAQPLLLSSKGRYVWSEQPIHYRFNEGVIEVSTREGEILTGKQGENINEVYQYVAKRFFPSNGKIPEPYLFTHPQYNTWIELMYDQNEKDILEYARAIIANGYPPGVLMIDDNWQEDYGNFEFSARRFQNPKGMMKELHQLGFKVMLWVCPFVSPDSEAFRHLAKEGMLLLEPQEGEVEWAETRDKAAIIRWWNGASALLDLSNPKTMKWFQDRLDHLVNEYGVDGFKLDAGDAEFYKNVTAFKPNLTPNDHTTFFAEVGLRYPLNEYRASWKMAGLPLAQRLRDKNHEWDDLAKLIPDLMSQSVMGYAYTCPDMIGGGEYQSFLRTETIDQELVVRSAQVHALMPMMQFSVAPWRILSAENNAICLKMAKLHVEMGPKILELANQSSKSGEPIAKPMAMAFPNGGYEMVKDQFVLGNDIIVAPVVVKGARKRTVLLPDGEWKAEDGSVHQGGGQIVIDVPLERLPYFVKQ